LLLDSKVDIFGIAESWLLPGVLDSFVAVKGYYILRTDTLGTVAKHGVCFYIRNSIVVESVDFNCPSVHVIKVCAYDVYVILVYRPPSSGEALDSALIDSLVQFGLGKETIVIGYLIFLR
jgi:hypothetical protein